MLSIIFVNYNTLQLIGESIESIYKFNREEFEILVVDNSTQEGEREAFLGKFPKVQWLQMGYNAGFARANNKGMKEAKGDTFLLLNPDTLSLDDSIASSYLRLKQSSYVGAGIQLLDREGQPQLSGSYFVKGGLNHLLPLPYWGALLRSVALGGGAKKPHVTISTTTSEADWISGAFLMVKKEATEKAGLMDEDFFLYGEEVEWCARLRKIGKLCIYGDLKMIHLEGESINKDQGIEEKGYYNLYDRKGLQLMVSNHLRVRKQYGVGWFLFLLLNYSWGVVFFFICSTVHRLFTLRNPFGDWGKVGMFGRNVLRVWGVTPSIISGKPKFYKFF